MTVYPRILKSILYVVMGLSLLPLTGCGASNDPSARIARAEKYQAEGKYRAAEIELKSLLQEKPNDAKGRFLFGKASLQLGDPAGAADQLKRALKLGEDPNEVLPVLAQALLDQGKYKAVLGLLDAKTLKQSTRKARLLVYRATAFMALKQFGDAKSALESSLHEKPGNAEALVGMSNLEMLRGDLASAESYLKKALDGHPDNVHALESKGTLEARKGDYETAVTTFRGVLKQKKSKLSVSEGFEVRGQLAGALINAGKLKEALSNVDRMLKQSPHHPFPNYLRALIAYREGDYSTASDHLDEVLRQVPNNIQAQALLGQVKYAQGNLGQADMYLSGVVAAQPGNVAARKLLASTLMREGQPAQALNELSAAAKTDSKDAGVLAMLGTTSLRLGKASQGIEYLQKSVAADPTSVGLKVQLAKAYIVTHEYGKALSILRKLPQSAGRNPHEREALMAGAYLGEGDAEAAIRTVEHLAEQEPKDPTAQNLLGKVYLILGKYDKARAAFKHALDLKPGDRRTLINLANLAVRQHNFDVARTRYNNILKSNPKDVLALLGLAQVEHLSGDDAAAVADVEKARHVDANAVQPRVILARYYLARRETGKALKAAQEAAQLAPHNPVVLELYATTRWASGDRQGALDSYSKAAKTAPGMVVYAFNLARAEAALGNSDDAKATLRKILKKTPKYIPAISMLARLEMQTGDKVKAFELAKSLKSQSGEKTSVGLSYTLEGDLYMMERDYQAAAKKYAAAFSRLPDRLLVMKLYDARRRGGVADAIRPLLDWLKKHPDDSGIRLALATAYQEKGKNKEAIKEYEQILKASPKNAGALNNLAWLYGQTGDPRAIETARKAHQLAPNAGPVSDTLGWLLLKSGDAAKALPILKDAASQAPNSGDILYHLAEAQHQTGDNASATQTLKGLLKKDSRMAENPDVKALMKALNVTAD